MASAFTIIAFIGLAAGLAWVGAAIVIPAIALACMGVKPGSAAAREWRGRVQMQYQSLGIFNWMFARCKLRLDPMFAELPELLQSAGNIGDILDVGCGHGVAGCALLQWFPQARIWAVDPNATRVHVAASAFGERGRVVQAAAPEIPSTGFPDRFALILLLDVSHYLSDAAFDLTLQRVRERLDTGGCLVMRAIIPPAGAGSRLWNLERIRRRIAGAPARYRSVEAIQEAIGRSGLTAACVKISGGNPESFWFIASAALEPGKDLRPLPSNEPAAQMQNQQQN